LLVEEGVVVSDEASGPFAPIVRSILTGVIGSPEFEDAVRGAGPAEREFALEIVEFELANAKGRLAELAQRLAELDERLDDLRRGVT
jgi:hypothetical protein